MKDNSTDDMNNMGVPDSATPQQPASPIPPAIPTALDALPLDSTEQSGSVSLSAPAPAPASLPNPSLLRDLGSALRGAESGARALRTAGKAPGPISGFPKLDAKMGGFLSPGYHCVMAAPGAGKTAMGLQIAAQCGCPALFVSSEMPRLELMRRFIARSTGTYLNRLRGGELSDSQLEALIETTIRAAPMVALLDAVEQRVACAEIQRHAQLLKRVFKSEHVLIIMDSVTDWAVSLMDGTTEYAALEEAITGLKAMSATLDAPIIAIAHRSRAGQKATGDDKLFTAKGTGRFEYASNTVWNLERDSSSAPDSRGQVKIKLTLLKNRFGECGSLDLLFEGRIQKFTEPDAGHGGSYSNSHYGGYNPGHGSGHTGYAAGHDPEEWSI